MTSFLDGPLKAAIAAGFKGKLLTGAILRDAPDGLDDFGDVQTSGSTSYSFEGLRENFSAVYAAQANIPATDVKVLVLLGSTTITPVQSDKININNGWYQVRRVLEIDPAGATASLQVYEIPEPTEG